MNPIVILKLSLASFCLVFANSVSVPFEIKKCKSTDTKCLKSSTQEIIPKLAVGLPSLGIKSLDPMVIEKIDSTSSNLKLILSNVKVVGLKDCTSKKLERDTTKKQFVSTLECTVEASGDYDMKGKILVVPLEGNDKFKVKISKAIFKVEGSFENIIKDGKTHWDITNWDFAYKLKESRIQFDNLFNGNKELAQAANDVINSNSNDVLNEIGVPVINKIFSNIIEAIKQFFHAIPAEDLALD